MTTIAAGNTAEIYVPLSCEMTFTPGAGGTMQLGFAVQSGAAAVAPQVISAATEVSVSAGSTVFARALTAAGTYDISTASEFGMPGGGVFALSEASPYVTPTASAGSSAFSGACELAGWYCSVAAGTITIYDALSATGTAIVPATTLVVGPLPIMGAGTTGKIALTTGCWVVLSGAATVRVLVA